MHTDTADPTLRQALALDAHGRTTTVITAATHDFADDDEDDSGPGGPGGPGGPPVSMSQLLSGGNPFGGGGGGGAEDMLINYNERFRNSTPPLFRDKVIEQTMAALISHRKPNAILVGPAGSGKTKIAEGIARLIAIGDPSVPDQLKDKIVYELPFNSLVSGASLLGEMEGRVQEIIEYASDPDNNVILFIDEIHQMVPDQAMGSSTDKISQQFKPALARGDMRVIGATTDQESKRLTNDPAFSRRFTRVGVSELTIQQTEVIVEKAQDELDRHYNHVIEMPESLIPTAVSIADEHLKTLHRPDNALTLIDRAMARATVQLHGLISSQVALAGHTLKLNRAMIKETAETMHGSDAERVTVDGPSLTQELTRIVGQDQVTGRVVELLRRNALQVFPQNKPLSWMFAGTSGVGKTEVARVIADHLLGREPIILNMAEYAQPYSITKLIGSPPGYIGSNSDRKMPFDALMANPWQVILLDEFEKAHSDVQQLFLSAMDSGLMETAMGQTLDFSKALIIATTNAGREGISKGGMGLGFGSDGKQQAADLSRKKLTEQLKGHFAPELLGRFSWLVAFNTIERDTFAQIAADLYVRLREQVIHTNPAMGNNLPPVLAEEVVQEITEKYYTPAQGARPAEPGVRDWIENYLETLVP